MHLPTDECCSVLPPEGLNITQLFPSGSHDATMTPSTGTSAAAPHVSNIVSSAPSQVTFGDLMEDSKLSSKVSVYKKAKLFYKINIVTWTWNTN